MIQRSVLSQSVSGAHSSHPNLRREVKFCPDPGTIPRMGDSGPEFQKTYRVVGNPDASRRKKRSEALLVWLLVGGPCALLVIYLVRLLAEWL